MQDQMCYFGYGSLVNEETLPAGTTVIPGELKGWRREWRGCATWNDGRTDLPWKGVCALGVREEEGASIRGAMVLDSKANLPALDKREWHYERKTLHHATFAADNSQTIPEDTFLYKVLPQHADWGSETFPILQSYVDCVMAGFHHLWGHEGMVHFIETTDGWDKVPVLDDREAPYYPRAVTLTEELTGAIDALLGELDLKYLRK